MLSEYFLLLCILCWLMMIWDENQGCEPGLIASFECAAPGRTFEEQLGHPNDVGR